MQAVYRDYSVLENSQTDQEPLIELPNPSSLGFDPPRFDLDLALPPSRNIVNLQKECALCIWAGLRTGRPDSDSVMSQEHLGCQFCFQRYDYMCI